VIPANQHLSSVLTDADTGVSAGFCVMCMMALILENLIRPCGSIAYQQMICLPYLELLWKFASPIQTADVPNGGVKKIFRIPAREFGQGCVLKVVMHCRVLPFYTINLEH
jgi:hypothetical protein